MTLSYQINYWYRLKTSGPRIEPWGNAVSTLAHEEYWPFNMTLWVLLSKKSVKVFKSSPDIPFCLSLQWRPWCHTFVKCFRYIKKYTPYFVALIKWFAYFVKDGNKLVDARVNCLKTGLIKSDQIILDEKFKHWVIEHPLLNFTADRQ